MGKYMNLEGMQAKDKLQYLIDNHGAIIIQRSEVPTYVNDPQRAVVVVVENPMFHACGFIYSDNEAKAWLEDTSGRKMTFVVMGRKFVEDNAH